MGVAPKSLWFRVGGNWRGKREVEMGQKGVDMGRDGRGERGVRAGGGGCMLAVMQITAVQ